jgi:hypothetical protein
MNKFIKKNLVLMIFMGFSAIAVAILLYMVIVEHASMRRYIRETEDLRNNIKKLIRQKPAPVAGNLDRIKNDIRRYKVKVKEIRNHFGQPYRFALEKFASEMGMKLDEFENRFKAFWEVNKKSGTTRDQVYRMFKASFKGGVHSWTKAMQEFIIEARKCTLENITVNNVDEIFLAALGLERTLSNSKVKCDAFMRSIRFKLIDYFMERKINFGNKASYFSFDFQKLPEKDQIPDIVKTWEIIGDLARRIANSRIKFLDSFEKRSIYGKKEGDFVYYRFTFKVTGDLNSMRLLVKNLYDAYSDNRVYVVRGITLEKVEDRAQDIIISADKLRNSNVRYDAMQNRNSDLPAERGVMLQPGRAESVRRPVVPAKSSDEDLEKDIPFYERKSYAQPVIGDDKQCNAVFDVDYVVFIGESLK